MAARLTLPEFLRVARARPFAWGRHDCALFAADWVLNETGHDPAAAWRGRYRSEAGAARAIEAAGGLEEAFDAALRGVWGRCPPPAAGVGVIEGNAGPTGAIRAGRMWAALSPAGTCTVRALDVECIAAWGPDQCHR